MFSWNQKQLKQLGHAKREAQLHTWLLVLIFTQVEELNSEVEELKAAFAEAREASQQTETQTFQVSVSFGWSGCLFYPYSL